MVKRFSLYQTALRLKPFGGSEYGLTEVGRIWREASPTMKSFLRLPGREVTKTYEITSFVVFSECDQ
jgi:hypothetical protein